MSGATVSRQAPGAAPGRSYLLPAIPFHRVTSSESPDHLADGIAHTQTRLPRCADDVRTLIEVPKILLESRSGVEVAEQLGIKCSHDYTEGEEDGPADGAWVELDALEEGHRVLELGRLEGFGADLWLERDIVGTILDVDVFFVAHDG